MADRLDALRAALSDRYEIERKIGEGGMADARFSTPWDVSSDGRFIMTRSITDGSARPATLVVIENLVGEVRRMFLP